MKNAKGDVYKIVKDGEGVKAIVVKKKEAEKKK